MKKKNDPTWVITSTTYLQRANAETGTLFRPPLMD